MPVDRREVRRLVLRSPPQHLRRAAFLVEDGLRTATLEGCGHALIVARALPLGPLDARESPAAVARRIERRWQEITRQAVWADAPQAAAAQAVRFASREEAWARYLARYALGLPAGEWFWPRLLPAGLHRAAPADLFVELALTLAAPPQGQPALLVGFVAALAGLAALPVLARQLAPPQVEPLLHLLLPGFRFVSGEAPKRIEPAAAGGAPRRRAPIPPVYAAVARGAAAQGLEYWPVAAFFLCVGLLAAQPWRFAAPESTSRELTAALQELYGSPATETAPAASPEPIPPGLVPPHSQPGDAAVETPPGSGQPPSASQDAQPPTAPATSPASASSPSPPAAGLRPPSAQPAGLPPTQDTAPFRETLASEGRCSPVAGVFFVLALLEWLEFPLYLEAHPDLLEQGLLPALLTAIARAAGALPEDPVLAVLASPEDPSDELCAAVREWHRQVHRCARRQARLLLRWIVRRPGRLVATTTHVDVYFDFSQMAVRLRRLGIDLDPGWVPALGKVVAYHYE